MCLCVKKEGEGREGHAKMKSEKNNKKNHKRE
jgi:hypothetical protein